MIQLATPISHLFADGFADKIIAHSDCLECRDRSIDSNYESQVLFHCEIQPIHILTDRQWEYFKKISELKKDLRLITFHIASVCSNPQLEGKMWKLGGKLFSEKELLENAKTNFSKIRELFGPSVDIAVENNNYYPSPAYDTVCEPSFISEIVKASDLSFLFDIAHAKVSAHNMGIEFDEYVTGLPMERVVQIHLCCPAIDEKGIAYDAHLPPTSEEIELVNQLRIKYPLKYLTVEYYRDIEILLESLQFVRKCIEH